MILDLGFQLFIVSGLFCVAIAKVCPDSSQWSFRTRAFCNSTHPSLNCLYDETTSTNVEFCTRKPDFQRPGYRFIIRGNIDGIECEKNRFQPFKFWTNGSNDCIFEKTHCNEPGQIIHNEGDSTSDRTCKCDYTRGFAFVSHQQNDCFCNPSHEDCSCFLKPCSKFQVMTPDYNCIDASDWTGVFKCPVITKTMTSTTTRCPTLPPDIIKSPIMAMVGEKSKALLLAAFFVSTIIIIILFTTYSEKIKKCCRNINMTGVVLEEMLVEARENEINDQNKMKEQTTNYITIVTGINTMKIVDKLQSMTESEKKAIDACTGRRQKNKELLEILWTRNSLYKEFIKTIHQSDSHQNLERLIENCTAYRKAALNDGTIPKDGKGFLEKFEENRSNKKISNDVRKTYNTYFETWYKDDDKFTVTSATREIQSKLKQNHCVVVIGRSGNGKSAIIRHIALTLFNEEGYDVIPIVLDLSNILRYHDPKRKQLFVLDDFCGKVVTNAEVVKMGSLQIIDVLKLIKQNPISTQHTHTGQGTIKLLFASQPFVFEQSSFNHENCLSTYKVCLSDHQLNDSEKKEMMKKYLPDSAEKSLPGISNYHKEIFPLLCKLSEGKTTNDTIDLFNNPDEIIKKDFITLQKTNKKQICLIALGVLFKHLTEDIFRQEYASEKYETIEVVCSEFDLDFSNTTTKMKLKDELANLEKTFFVKSHDTYYFAHKDIYNIAALLCGEILQNCFIRFAYSSFIAERYSFVSPKTNGRETNIYIVNEDTKRRYFDRLMNDLEQGITYSTFHNCQLKDKSYRTLFCTYCYGRKKFFVKLLNRLQNWASQPPKNRGNNQIVSRKDSSNDYEDYIDFINSWQFSSHNMKIPLIESAWEGHKEIVKMLIDLEPDVNETDKFGKSALYVACYRGKADVVQLLIEGGADLSKCEADEKSPLYAACKGGHTQIVKILLAKGAIASQCDQNGYSPLHAASAEGHRDIIPLLVTKNNVDNYDNLGRSALFVASDYGRKGIVKLLIKENANINNSDMKGFSPLMAACSRGSLDVVKELIYAKPDEIKINDQDVDGRSALSIASKKGHDEIVKILLSHKADVLKLDCHQQSPLFIASSFGHEKVVKLLVNYDKTISQSDEEKKTPLFIACEKGQEIIVDILLSKCLSEDVLKTDNKKRSPLYVACRGGFIGIVKKLTGKGAQTNVFNIWDETPLFAASRGGHVKVVRYLIENNADPNSVESNGHTPLWIACDEGHVEIVKLLVGKGAAINRQDNDKRTPLYAASKGNYVEVVMCLIDNKADLNAAESNGQTPLWIACNEGHVEIVNILVKKGADINHEDNDKRTPSDIAQMRGHTEIENILKQKLST